MSVGMSDGCKYVCTQELGYEASGLALDCIRLREYIEDGGGGGYTK